LNTWASLEVQNSEGIRENTIGALLNSILNNEEILVPLIPSGFVAPKLILEYSNHTPFGCMDWPSESMNRYWLRQIRQFGCCHVFAIGNHLSQFHRVFILTLCKFDTDAHLLSVIVVLAS
jgi:hypothetical protein